MDERENVVLRKGIVDALHKYLTEIGRIGNRTSQDLGSVIKAGVTSQWGSAKVKQFQDDKGIGWIVDLTERFRGEVLYAIVRAKEGVRYVSEIADAESVEEMFSSPSRKNAFDLPAMEEIGLDSKNPSGPSLAQQGVMKENAELKVKLKSVLDELSRLKKSDSQSPTLICWQEKESASPMQEEIKEMDIQTKINQLIDSGVKAHQIVVWTKRQQPKIKIELE